MRICNLHETSNQIYHFFNTYTDSLADIKILFIGNYQVPKAVMV